MTFEEKVERLSAIEDIKQLKARYCQLCDAGYDPDGIAAMFVEDGVWDGGEQFGCHVGREAIHGFFSGVSSDIVFRRPPGAQSDHHRGWRHRQRQVVADHAMHNRARRRAEGKRAGCSRNTTTTTSGSTAPGTTSTCAST